MSKSLKTRSPRRIPTPPIGCERQQSQVTGTFDSTRYPPLMFGAKPCLTSRSDLSPPLDIGLQETSLLIVYFRPFTHTESASSWRPWASKAPSWPTPSCRSRTSWAPSFLSSCRTLRSGHFRLFSQIRSPSPCQDISLPDHLLPLKTRTDGGH